MQKRWLIKSAPDSTTIESFRSKLKVDRIISTLLLQRGITSFDEAESFFRPNLSDLHDPFLMKDMATAVERLQLAINSKEKVLLFGDYDVDGTTAVALLYSVLNSRLDIDFYIPDRYKEGYGVSKSGIDFASENDFSLIIALDCGIKSIEEINYANEQGVDFIICDHHTPGELLPDAIVLDPKRKDCDYPYKELSGCGVGFKLMQAYFQKSEEKDNILWDNLDLLALSIGADIVDVTGENRILCYHGLKLLNEFPRPAFKELIEIAKRSFPLTLTDLVFTIAPRINAAGRLRSGKHAVQLMISSDYEQICELAKEINEDNLQRRALDSTITQEALAQIENNQKYEQSVTTVVYHESWHKGVVGIVASRLIESHYRPTIVLTKSNGLLTGSARSVMGIDLYQALDSCNDLLEQFGGHKFAAGLTLREENLDQFIQAFDDYVAAIVTEEMKVELQEIDLEIKLSEIYSKEENRMKIPRLMRILQQLEPYGPGNMKPVFLSRNLFSQDIRVLKDAHLKLNVTDPDSDVALDAIAFNQSEKEDEVAFGIPYDLVYTLEINKWNNRENLQLNVKDIRGFDN